MLKSVSTLARRGALLGRLHRPLSSLSSSRSSSSSSNGHGANCKGPCCAARGLAMAAAVPKAAFGSSAPGAAAAAAAAVPKGTVVNAADPNQGNYAVDAALTAEPADDSKRNFTYFALASGRLIYASTIRFIAIRFISSMSASADVLALSSIEVDLDTIAAGQMVTLNFRGKPLFVRHRTDEEIASAAAVDHTSLRDPQTDAERFPLNPKWAVVLGVCTHLGCVPIGGAGAYNGWFCPCHGSQFDNSGRARAGPAPLNLEIPEFKFLSDTVMKVG